MSAAGTGPSHDPGTSAGDTPSRQSGTFAVHVEGRDAPLATRVRRASSLWARFLGLMGRRALDPGEGLWLPGDTSIHMLFMRIPIDAIFLAPAGQEAGGSAGSGVPVGSVGSEGSAGSGVPAGSGGERWRVVAIRERLRPWTGVVWYVRGARGCLEVAAGAATEAGLRPGDALRFEPLP